MAQRYVIGLDCGTLSARGVLIDIASGAIVKSAVAAYAHGVIDERLSDGTPLPRGWALQDATDYTAAIAKILKEIAEGCDVAGIGLGFTASSPMPVSDTGAPLSEQYPRDPHAYVKLWKHGAAQAFADRINAAGGSFLDNYGGKLSAEWLLPKAWQMAEESPHLWGAAARFIESGDWLVSQLTGQEVRSLGFAAYKAQYTEQSGYPDIVPGLAAKLSQPRSIGSAAGPLSSAWRARTGIRGEAIVSVAVIDSHLILPAVGATSSGTLAAALGTSAVYLYLGDQFRPLPPGIEGVAFDGSVPGLWCYEAGQAGFGDTLQWFVDLAPKSPDTAENFRLYNEEAAKLAPGASGLVALDWWNGNRVPHADSRLSGLLLGLTRRTTAATIYRALIESLCFGARSVADLYGKGGFPIDRVIMGSGLARNNPFLMQVMSDVLGREIEVPVIEHASAVGAAIHGAYAGGVVKDFAEGTKRFGARDFTTYHPDPQAHAAYDKLYTAYAALAASQDVRSTMHGLAE